MTKKQKRALKKGQRLIANASRATRRKWALKASRTRAKSRLADCEGKLQSHMLSAHPRVLGLSAEDYAGYRPERSVEEYAGVPKATNPELMLVHNPVPRSHLGYSLSVRHRRTTMRRRSGKKAVRVGGKRRTWKGLVRKFGVKKAARIWRSSKKIGGKKRRSSRRRRARNSWKGHKRAHARAARKGWRKRRHRGSRRKSRRGKRCRKGSYRALVRKFGVKKASKKWRKSRCKRRK